MIDIDFVVLWVDGDDPKWQKSFRNHCPGNVCDPARYRDWGLFKYWFRAVEKYAPWVHRIFVVTDNQCPDFLNVNHPKIQLVDHKDFMPESYLPCYNSASIELNIHRISGLSEHFVYFNDDIFLNAPVTPEDYFYNGLPRCATRERLTSTVKYYGAVELFGHTPLLANSIAIINYHFSRRDVIRKNLFRWYNWHYDIFSLRNAFVLKKSKTFCGFKFPHSEFPYLKSVFEEAWATEPYMLDLTSKCHVRGKHFMTIYFMMMWQFVTNKFWPVVHRECIYNTINDVTKVSKSLASKAKSVVVNDELRVTMDDYHRCKPLLMDLFEKRYASKSSFEL